jgi:hypothetical protein
MRFKAAVRAIRAAVTAVRRSTVMRDHEPAATASLLNVADHERVRELQSVLLEAADAAAPYLNAAAWEPSVGSEGAAEVANTETGPAGPWGENPVRTTHALVHALMDTVLTHVRALALLYVDEPPAMATATVARSVMEAAATAWWIMEPGIGTRGRVARVTSERLRSSREATKAIVHLAEPVNPSDYSETEDQVRNYAIGLGLQAAAGHPRIDRQVRPSSTDLIAGLFETESALDRSQSRPVYPVYAGVAHGLLYGIMQFLRPVEADGQIILRWQTDPHVIDAVVSYTLTVMIAAMDRIIAVMGWDAATWDTWKSTLYSHFSAS